MKFYFKPILSLVVLAVLFGYAGCGGSKDPGPTEEEQALTNLTATWKVGDNVTLDGVSKKADYANFTLTIAGTPGSTTYTYSTAGRPQLSPWPASGTWKFGSTVSTDIIRDPDNADKSLDMHYSVNGNALTLTFTYNDEGESASRTDVVKGVWVFDLTKN